MSRFRLWCDVPYGLFGLGHMACIVDDPPKPAAAASLLPMPRGAPVGIVVVSITLTPVQKTSGFEKTLFFVPVAVIAVQIAGGQR